MTKEDKNFFDLPERPIHESMAVILMTGEGPERILEASGYVELYDEELDCQPSDMGIGTQKSDILVQSGPGTVPPPELLAIYEKGSFPVMIGGDRRISAAGMAAARSFHPDVSMLLLAGTLPGEEVLSCLTGNAGVGPLGIIGLKARPADPPDGTVFLQTSRELMEKGLTDPWEGSGRTVYISIHPDFFEPAYLPWAGNSEPGGLDWWRTMDILRDLFGRRGVLGADICGYSPRGPAIVSDFTLAKLVYKIIGYALCPGRAAPAGSNT